MVIKKVKEWVKTKSMLLVDIIDEECTYEINLNVSTISGDKYYTIKLYYKHLIANFFMYELEPIDNLDYLKTNYSGLYSISIQIKKDYPHLHQTDSDIVLALINNVV